MAQLQEIFTIPNELGLHARVASRLVKLCTVFSSTVQFVADDSRTANAKSVLDLLTLGAECGQQVTITVSGDDADVAMAAISQLFENNLGD